MPVTVPTADEFEATETALQTQIDLLTGQLADLDARLTALEAGTDTPPDTETPPDPPDPTPTTGRCVTLTFEDAGDFVFTQEGATDLGDYVCEHFTQHCYMATNPDMPGFRVYFRPDATSDREEIVFELGEIWPSAPTNALGAYTVTIAKDDEVLAVIEARLGHYYYSRWRWQSAPRPLITDIADLIARKLVPNYSSAVGTAWPSTPRTYAHPMDLAGITPYMPQTGERDDIGIVTEATGDYLCTGSPPALSSMMAWLEASGTLPWHYRDEKTHAPLDTFEYPRASSNNPNNSDPYIPLYGQGGPITCDISHEPDLAYVPFLLTQDPYALEELQFAAVYNVVCQPPDSRAYNYYNGALRGHAWGLRCMARCVVITPDDPPQWLLPKSYFQRLMDGNRDFVTAFATNPANPYHSLSIMSDAGGAREEPPCPAETVISPWMDDFELAVQGHVLELGFADWRSIYEWNAQNLIARCSPDSGWPPAYFTNYRFPVRLTAQSPYATSWADAWAINLQMGYLPQPADPNAYPVGGDLSYPGYANAALAMAERHGIDGAEAAHKFVHDGITASIATVHNAALAAKWSIA